jgi:hypothetical protein
MTAIRSPPVPAPRRRTCWGAAQLDYDVITAQPAHNSGSPDDVSHNAYAISIGELLECADGSASAGADADSGVLTLDAS